MDYTKHLIEEEKFYLKEYGYHKSMIDKHPKLKDVLEKNMSLCWSIILGIREQLKNENNK